MNYPKTGEKLRDVKSGRVGTFTGLIKTVSPPGFCVIWDDDGTDGSINERNLMRCASQSADAAGRLVDEGSESMHATLAEWERDGINGGSDE